MDFVTGGESAFGELRGDAYLVREDELGIPFGELHEVGGVPLGSYDVEIDAGHGGIVFQ